MITASTTEQSENTVVVRMANGSCLLNGPGNMTDFQSASPAATGADGMRGYTNTMKFITSFQSSHLWESKMADYIMARGLQSVTLRPFRGHGGKWKDRVDIALFHATPTPIRKIATRPTETAISVARKAASHVQEKHDKRIRDRVLEPVAGGFRVRTMTEECDLAYTGRVTELREFTTWDQ